MNSKTPLLPITCADRGIKISKQFQDASIELVPSAIKKIYGDTDASAVAQTAFPRTVFIPMFGGGKYEPSITPKNLDRVLQVLNETLGLLEKNGVKAVPHLAVSRLGDFRVAQEIIGLFFKHNIDELLLIGGDRRDSPFPVLGDCLTFMQKGYLQKLNLKQIFFAGHPHGIMSLYGKTAVSRGDALLALQKKFRFAEDQMRVDTAVISQVSPIPRAIIRFAEDLYRLTGKTRFYAGVISPSNSLMDRVSMASELGLLPSFDFSIRNLISLAASAPYYLGMLNYDANACAEKVMRGTLAPINGLHVYVLGRAPEAVASLRKSLMSSAGPA